MNRKKLYILGFFLLLSLGVSARTAGECLRMMPDSICPLANDVKPDRETSEYLHVALSEVSELEMRMLPSVDGDTLVCVVQTFKAPLAESDVRVYDLEWKECKRLAFGLADILGEEPSSSLRSLFDPLLISAHLDAESENITLILSYSNLSDEEKKEIEGLKLQTTLKWNGETFK